MANFFLIQWLASQLVGDQADVTRALTVVAGLVTVGVLMVITLIIAPAVTARLLGRSLDRIDSDRRRRRVGAPGQRVASTGRSRLRGGPDGGTQEAETIRPTTMAQRS